MQQQYYVPQLPHQCGGGVLCLSGALAACETVGEFLPRCPSLALHAASPEAHQPCRRRPPPPAHSTFSNRRFLYIFTQSLTLTEVPHIEKFSEKDNARQGFFESDEFEMIVALLPHYLKDVTRFAYYTGWRKGEILTLEWRDMHGDVIRLRPEIAKNKDGSLSW